MHRDIELKFKNFYRNHPKKAVMLLGARQVGKTYAIKKFAMLNYKSVVAIDFVQDKSNLDLVLNASSDKEIMLRISVKFGKMLQPNNTMIIFDEVQVVPEIITHIKYLVQNYPYDFILSGSLLGAILNEVDSVPVGYIDIWRMGPMSFKEFLIADGKDPLIIEKINNCVEKKSPIDEYVHNYLLDIFRKYLIVGGMPDVVKTYFSEHNLSRVHDVQSSIIKTYKSDISKYNPDNKIYMNEIYGMVPSQLNNQNKRFFINKLKDNARFSIYENSFYWLKNAGAVLPAYRCSDTKTPLIANKDLSKFKLYMSDVGLLTCCYGQNAQMRLLQNIDNINCGAIYENVMAQMLSLSYPELYYYQNKQRGEVDFIIESEQGLTALEVKSGKDYKRHVALRNLISCGNCKYATVVCNSNIKEIDNILYLPIYVFGLLYGNPSLDIEF